MDTPKNPMTDIEKYTHKFALSHMMHNAFIVGAASGHCAHVTLNVFDI